jgi:protein OS-9
MKTLLWSWLLPGRRDKCTLPRLESLGLDASIYSPSLDNDFLNIPVDKDLTAWRRLSVRFLPESALTLNIPEYRMEEYLVSGDHFKCAIPPDQADEITIPTKEEQKEMQEQASRALKNFAYSSGGCLRHREGWWTYEICHKRRVRQYHVVTEADRSEAAKSSRRAPPVVGSVSSEYLLGRYLPNHPDALSIKFGNVFTMTYVDGERCRTTDRGTISRRTEVRFVCSEGRLSPHFIDVFEDRICHYVFVVGTPALCNIPPFRRALRPKQTIMCVSGSVKEQDATSEETGQVKSFKLAKIAELFDSSDTFPLLKQAIVDLLQSELGAVMPDLLTSHLPRRSLFDVFSDLKAESEAQSEANNGNNTDQNAEQGTEKPKKKVFQLKVDL